MYHKFHQYIAWLHFMENISLDVRGSTDVGACFLWHPLSSTILVDCLW